MGNKVMSQPNVTLGNKRLSDVITFDSSGKTSQYFLGNIHIGLETAFKSSHDISPTVQPEQAHFEKDETAISDIVITNDGLVTESWTKIENIPSQVIEANTTTVLLECLIDFEQQVFEKREFSADLLDANLSRIGSLVLIKIFTRPNEIRFTFSDGKDLVSRDYFEAKDVNDIFESLRPAKHLTKKIRF